VLAGQRVEDLDAAVVEDRQRAEGREVDGVGEGLVLSAGERGGTLGPVVVWLAGGVVVAGVRVVGAAPVGIGGCAGQRGLEALGGRVFGQGVARGAAVLGGGAR